MNSFAEAEATFLLAFSVMLEDPAIPLSDKVIDVRTTLASIRCIYDIWGTTTTAQQVAP